MNKFFQQMTMAALLALAFAPAANAATYNWTFTSASSISASGVLTVDANDQVTALSGLIGGQAITFYSNPNFPGTSTYHGVPNTGGADYIYDDYFNPSTNAVTGNGILMSIGSGAGQVFYDLSVDGGAPSANADLFSITSSGGYVFNEGVISSSEVLATPLPSGWTMLVPAMMIFGFMGYRQRKLQAA